MKTLLLALALALGFTSPAMAAMTTNQATTPTCVNTDVATAKDFAIMVYHMAVTVSANGGKNAVESSLTRLENVQASKAIEAMYPYASGTTKCWNISPVQALSLLKATDAMAGWLKTAGKMEAFFQNVVNAFSAADAGRIF